MSLRRTGPGVITIDNKYVLPGGIKALLSNYDIDGDTPKQEHLDFLNTRVAPLLVSHPAHIWLQGSASHSGSDQHNMDLSQRRVNKVVAHLVSRGVLMGQIQPSAVGETMAMSGVNEDQRDRAVAVLVLGVAPSPPPPPPRPVIPATPTSMVFRIRMLGGLGGGSLGLAADQLYFQIWDHRNSLTCFYQYTGGGLGRSVRLPLSVTMRGPWNEFTTTGPISVNQFGGAARFTTAGGGNWTSNHLNMMGLPPGLATVPRSMPINTGFTVGIGASTTVGDLIIFNGTPWPFTGP